MALSLKKRNLSLYDIEVWTDISGSMSRKDCPGGVNRLDYARGWVQELVKEAAAYDDDGVTVGFFDNELITFENTTFDKVLATFKTVKPRGTTPTHILIDARCADYLDKRLGKAEVKGGWLSKGTPAIPANPKQKPRIILIITDGAPDDKSKLMTSIIDVTKRMTAGGLTKDDLVLSFVQVGMADDAKVFLEKLNNGLEAKGATMDIVGCILGEQAMKLSTLELLEKALDAE